MKRNAKDPLPPPEKKRFSNVRSTATLLTLSAKSSRAIGDQSRLEPSECFVVYSNNFDKVT